MSALAIPAVLVSEGTSRYVVQAGPHYDDVGMQIRYRFPNGYGASVIQGPYTYGGDKGLFELGVTLYTGPEPGDADLTYLTPVTDDVLGYLTPSEVEDALLAIKALPAADGITS